MRDGESVDVLALNSGSSSLKFGLYRVGPRRIEMLLAGAAESIGDSKGRFHAKDPTDRIVISESTGVSSQRDAVARIERLLAECNVSSPAAIGHRVVHGGPKLRRHCLIDEGIMRELEAAVAFAPLHVPPALSVIRFAQDHFPGVPQAACLDTTFHAHMPDVARVLPIAKELRADGVYRYGFHGLSCESIVHQLGAVLPDRLIIAHLGNGASITAVRNGRSIDTSMGLTPTGGVVMGTRSGDLDPGVLLYLMRERGFDAARLEDLVDHRSGLLGVSGIGSDMRLLREAAGSSADARLAIDMFCYSVRKQVSAMIAVLGGVDLIVFTGGIGENDVEARASICDGLAWMDVVLDEERNKAARDPISGLASRCLVRVLASEEDEQIARHTASLVPSIAS